MTIATNYFFVGGQYVGEGDARRFSGRGPRCPARNCIASSKLIAADPDQGQESLERSVLQHPGGPSIVGAHDNSLVANRDCNVCI